MSAAMVCPNCGRDFDWHVTTCPACGAELLDRSPGQPPTPNARLVPVFAASDPGVIPLARSLLDAEGIEHFVRGEGVQDLFGAGRIGGFNVLVGPAEFLVREEDADRARDLLADLHASGDQPPEEPDDAA